MFQCAACSNVPNTQVAKCSIVPNVQVRQQQQLHKRRRSIKSPFTCFACLAWLWPDSLNGMKLWKEQQQWEEMKLFRGRKVKVEVSQSWGNIFLKQIEATGLVFEDILIPSFTTNRGDKKWNSSRRTLNTLTKLGLQQSSPVCRLWHMGLTTFPNC